MPCSSIAAIACAQNLKPTQGIRSSERLDSLRFLSPCDSAVKYRLIRPPYKSEASGAIKPVSSKVSSTLLTAPWGSIKCPAVICKPGERVVQLKLLLSSSSVTLQTLGRNRGCRTLAPLPIAIGPLSKRRTLDMVGVHSGQRSTSHSTANTFSGGASIVTAALKVFRLTLQEY
jgi:hypothetical protein